MQTSSKRMRRLSAYIISLILIIACGEKETMEYTIQGEGVGTGTVYLFGSGDVLKQLTSTGCDDKFTLSTPLDSKAMLTLILPNESSLTIFAEPGTVAKLQSDSTLKSGWAVTAGRTQLLHDSISRVLDATDDFEKRKKLIEEFANRYPTSEVTVELFRRYLVDIPKPDNGYIMKAIERLGGTMQNHEYFSNLKRRLKEKHGNVRSKMFPSFKYSTIDNEKIDLGTYSGRYLLITFWDTGSNESREYLKGLREVEEKVTGESFAILNVAIGNDTAEVRKFVEENNIVGNNTYDPKGMNSEVLEPFNIPTLPFSVLLTPYKRTERYLFSIDSVDVAFIDSLTLVHDKRIKR